MFLFETKRVRLTTKNTDVLTIMCNLIGFCY